MKFLSKYLVLVILGISCVEPYEFVIKDGNPGLVIESFVSDKSYDDSKLFPSDGRYFSARLTWTGDVNNVRPIPVEGATIRLLSDQGQEWSYLYDRNGMYYLRDNTFSALPGVHYKLVVSVDDIIVESDWEAMPDVDVPPMGDISFVEGTKQAYVMMANEPFLTTLNIVTAQIDVPLNTSGKTIHYYWKFHPTWVYRAPLSASMLSPGHICWISDDNLLSTYQVQLDAAGGYRRNLFDVQTTKNTQIYEDYSVLILQHAIAEDRYFFLKDMLDQHSGPLVDRAPFNLTTNFHPSAPDTRVSGFFSVVKEHARRWYFNRNDLSYTVVNTARADCDIPDTDPGPECFDCRRYQFGTPVDVKPSWWRR